MKNTSQFHLFALFFSLTFSLFIFGRQSYALPPLPNVSIDKLIINPAPDGHKDFLDAIVQAQSSIHMMMFHLTDAQAVDALLSARKRGVQVQVILDNKSTLIPKFNKAYKQLQEAGVQAVKSSSGFSIMHAKAMVVDSKLALITSINLTNLSSSTRDYGIVTRDPQIISEMEKVFSADIQNANTDDIKTPELLVENLLWSPNNSLDKLVALIDSATADLKINIENLGHPAITDAFIRAAQRGVHIQLLAPMCDKNPDPLYNYPVLKKLSDAGIATKVMPYPESAETPYMHSKMILVDHQRIYIGSVNFSNNSIGKARELGIIFDDNKIAPIIESEFNKDWSAAAAAVAPALGVCPVIN